MIARRQVQWWLAGALLAGLLGGGLWPLPPAPEVSDREAPWSLPLVGDLQRHAPQDLDTLIRNLPWNSGAAEADAQADTRWRLVGIIREQQPLILVQVPDQPNQVQRIHIGEPLPDDSVLDAVENDQALIRQGECVTTWHLFHPQPIATSAACQAAEEPLQGTPP